MVKSDVYSSPIIFSQLDLRVGKVIEVKAHPTSEKHYIERVEVGKDEVLEMVMEHQPYLSEEEILDRKVIVLCNLKEVKIQRTKSKGLILAFKNDKGTFEFMEPAPEAEVGERVYAVGEEQQDPVTPIQMKKNKVWETLNKEIKTSRKLEIMFKDRFLVRTRSGPCHVESVAKAGLCL